jgi:hypothetical protein
MNKFFNFGNNFLYKLLFDNKILFEKFVITFFLSILLYLYSLEFIFNKESLLI